MRLYAPRGWTSRDGGTIDIDAAHPRLRPGGHRLRPGRLAGWLQAGIAVEPQGGGQDRLAEIAAGHGGVHILQRLVDKGSTTAQTLPRPALRTIELNPRSDRGCRSREETPRVGALERGGWN